MSNRQRRTLTLAALVFLPPALLAQQPDARVLAAIERQTAAAVEVRRQIHENPELGNREVKTAALVADHFEVFLERGEREVAGSGSRLVLGGVVGHRVGAKRSLRETTRE